MFANVEYTALKINKDSCLIMSSNSDIQQGAKSKNIAIIARGLIV